MTTFELS